MISYSIRYYFREGILICIFFLLNGKNYRARIAPELFTKPNSIPGTVINSVDPIFRLKKNSKSQISFAFRNFA